MRLYQHPMSANARAAVMTAFQLNVPVELVYVDLQKREQLEPQFLKMNPNHRVPVLEDGDFRLTECSAILKYFADKINSPAYPKDLKQRARVNEVMDWFNSQFYRDYGYGMIYPQLFPNLKRPNEEVHKATIAWGKENFASYKYPRIVEFRESLPMTATGKILKRELR